MNENFWNGFEKQASKAEAAALAAAAAAYFGGTGALIGHASHVGKKMDYARHGKDYKEKSFIDKHPKLTGALSLGLAPALSHGAHRKKLDLDNPKVRKVMAEHPFITHGNGV
jgi:hypothetical protein